MSISPTSRVAVVALEISGAAKILEKFGIDYCYGGERSLEEACLDAGASVQDVLSSLREADLSAEASPDFFDWNSASLSQLVSHIVDTHHAFTRKELERLAPVLARVCSAHGNNHPELRAIQELFSQAADKGLFHLQPLQHGLPSL